VFFPVTSQQCCFSQSLPSCALFPVTFQ
jgi:hypothetical protein